MLEEENRTLFTENKIFWAHRVEFSTHFYPWGKVSVGSISRLWIMSLWVLISWESQSLEAPGLGRKLDELWKQFWRLSPWSKWLAHSVACQCFRLQTVNHEVHIDLSHSPSHWLIFNCCALLSLSLRKVSSMKKEAAWFNWKSKGLMSDRPAWLHHLPAAWVQGQFLWKWKLEPMIPVLQGCFCWEEKWKLHGKCRALGLAHIRDSTNGHAL